MVKRKQPTAQDFLRLDAIAKHLGVKRRYPHTDFTSEVIEACLSRIAPVVDKLLPCTGEQIALGLAEHLYLTFEEVHGPHDVSRLENHYVRGKKEIGFAQLRGELERPGVDALLFELINAEERDPDRWVAVLNLQDSMAKGYWNRFHELSHRIAEPPQGILPLRRHQFEATNPVESLIDSVAAEFAFYAAAFQPLVVKCAKRSKLNFALVDAIRSKYAPTASLLSTVKAIVKFWPNPAAALVAEFRGRVNAPDVDQGLRMTLQGYSATAEAAGMGFFPNMRIPVGSPIYLSYETGTPQDDGESLGKWVTSRGERLAPLQVHSSAIRIGKRVYALVSM